MDLVTIEFTRLLLIYLWTQCPKVELNFLQVKYAYIEKRDWINFFDEGIDGFAIGVDEKYCMY